MAAIASPYYVLTLSPKKVDIRDYKEKQGKLTIIVDDKRTKKQELLSSHYSISVWLFVSIHKPISLTHSLIVDLQIDRSLADNVFKDIYRRIFADVIVYIFAH